MESVTYLPLSNLVGSTNAVITTAFKQKCVPGKPWKSGWHNGIDIACDTGTPIYAAADGIVVNVDTAAHNDGFGNRCIILHPDGRATMYAHMFAPADVKIDQKITKGQKIGRIGSTGLSTGPHLHITLLDRYKENPNIYYSGYLLDPAIILGLGTLKYGLSATPNQIPTEENTNYQIATSNFDIGDIVEFHGERHFTSTNGTAGYPCTSGKAKITNIAKGIHPYHLVHVDTNSTVYGWVDEEDIIPQNEKTVDELAQEVIRGEWGNGSDRQKRLTAAGYDYHKVQKKVNNLLYNK